MSALKPQSRRSGATKPTRETDITTSMITVDAAAETLTILITAEANKRATKKIHKNGGSGEIEFVQFDAGMYFSALRSGPITDISGLSELLTALESMPQCLVIRGEPVDQSAADLGRIRRTGSGEGDAFQGNFRTPDHGRRYVLIDVDKLKLPDGMSLSPDSVEAICEYVISHLPKEFHKASYHWQLSSSAGFTDPGRVSLHLWFWLDRPVHDLELRRWGKFVNEKAGMKLVDTALFGHVQPHYTAAPVFDGVQDPFPVRSGLVVRPLDSVALVLPPLPQRMTTRNVVSSATGASTCKGFENHLKRIGDHAGGEGFHVPLRDAAASYVSTNGISGTDREVLFDLLAAAVFRADRSNHSDTEVGQRASREHIMPLIDSALVKYGDTKSAVRKPKFYENIEPHYQSQPMSVEAIQAELSNMLPSVRSFNVRDSS